MFSPASLVFYRYPAPGCRSRTVGALFLVGSEGSVWSSSVSDTHSMDLNFIMTWFSSSYASYRDYGFQVRCLSE